MIRDKEARKKYNANYRIKNLEKLRLYDRERDKLRTDRYAIYYSNNKEKIRERKRLLGKTESYRAKARKRYENLSMVTYRYEDLDGNVLYVGSGTSKRPMEHKYKRKTESPWWNENLKLIIQDQPTLAHARRDEYQWIIDYNPMYNLDAVKSRRKPFKERKFIG